MTDSNFEEEHTLVSFPVENRLKKIKQIAKECHSRREESPSPRIKVNPAEVMAMEIRARLRNVYSFYLSKKMNRVERIAVYRRRQPIKELIRKANKVGKYSTEWRDLEMALMYKHRKNELINCLGINFI